MGCCMSQSALPPPMEQMQYNGKLQSFTTTHTETSKPAHPKQFALKQEPQMSFELNNQQNANKNSMDRSLEKSTSKPEEELTLDLNDKELENSYTPDTPEHLPQTQTVMETTKSDFQLKMEARKSEIMAERAKLARMQSEAFDQQVATQQSRSFKRLYDVWNEYATSEDGQTMDMYGLTKALAVFGMIIDVDKDFQRHIFKKFDLDNEKEITYNDFSATIASFVGSNTDDDSLQTLFEIFDIDRDGYLELEDMARILLAQNQIAVVVTGQKSESTKKVYTKKQCLKQARRMIAEYDSEQFNDNKISFDEFSAMMNQRTEDDMIIDHMAAPSISIQHASGEHALPVFLTDNHD